MPQEIEVGDTVAYSDIFIRRQNRYPTDMASAQGKVKALHRLDKGVVLADIKWDKPGLPKRVNIRTSPRRKPPPSGSDRPRNALRGRNHRARPAGLLDTVRDRTGSLTAIAVALQTSSTNSPENTPSQA